MTEPELGPNIFRLERKTCRKPDGSGWKTEHGPFLIDEALETVECGNCGAVLTASKVLASLALHEVRLTERFKRMKAEIEKTWFKAQRQNKVRCEHCQKMTRIRRDQPK